MLSLPIDSYKTLNQIFFFLNQILCSVAMVSFPQFPGIISTSSFLGLIFFNINFAYSICILLSSPQIFWDLDAT